MNDAVKAALRKDPFLHRVYLTINATEWAAVERALADAWVMGVEDGLDAAAARATHLPDNPYQPDYEETL